MHLWSYDQYCFRIETLTHSSAVDNNKRDDDASVESTDMTKLALEIWETTHHATLKREFYDLFRHLCVFELDRIIIHLNHLKATFSSSQQKFLSAKLDENGEKWRALKD